MTTYAIYKCDTCKRNTEAEVDPRRPSFDHCVITYKCKGRLQLTGYKSVRSQLVSKPVVGLENWKPRNAAPVTKGSAAPVSMSATSGSDVLTLSLPQGLAATIHATFSVEPVAASSFTSYLFYGFTSDVGSIYGPESANAKKVLRFGPTDNVVCIADGVSLQRAVRAIIEPIVAGGSIVGVNIINEGSGYDTAPTLTPVGTGAGAQLIAHVSDGAITSVDIANQGVGYSLDTTIAVSGGVTAPSVFYEDITNQMLHFSPTLKNVSTIDVTVVPSSPLESLSLSFRKTDSSTYQVGSWGNVLSVKQDQIRDVFVCDDLNNVKMESHITLANLLDQNDQALDMDMCHLLFSANPNTSIDREYRYVFASDSTLFRTFNILGDVDVLIDSDKLKSIYPPMTILDMYKSETLPVDRSPSKIEIAPLTEQIYILGPT